MVFFFDGYLGYGYGELVYILFVCVQLVLSLLILLIKKNLNEYRWLIFFVLIVYYVCAFNLIY